MSFSKENKNIFAKKQQKENFISWSRSKFCFLRTGEEALCWNSPRGKNFLTVEHICCTTFSVSLSLSLSLSLCLSLSVPSPVWPDVEVKSSPNFRKVIQKWLVSHSNFYLKSDVFQNSPKRHHAFGQICEKIFHQELSRVAQSGHTCPNQPNTQYKNISNTNNNSRY